MTDPTKPSILLVDDEPAIRSILDRFLTGGGYRVVCSGNGAEGLKRFQETPFDVVIVDRGMPEMNGEEMARRIKETHPHVPMILITGLPHLITSPQLFVRIVPKPFRPAELMELIAHVTTAGCRCGE